MTVIAATPSSRAKARIPGRVVPGRSRRSRIAWRSWSSICRYSGVAADRSRTMGRLDRAIPPRGFGATERLGARHHPIPTARVAGSPSAGAFPFAGGGRRERLRRDRRRRALSSRAPARVRQAGDGRRPSLAARLHASAVATGSTVVPPSGLRAIPAGSDRSREEHPCDSDPDCRSSWRSSWWPARARPARASGRPRRCDSRPDEPVGVALASGGAIDLFDSHTSPRTAPTAAR